VLSLTWSDLLDASHLVLRACLPRSSGARRQPGQGCSILLPARLTPSFVGRAQGTDLIGQFSAPNGYILFSSIYPQC